MTQFPYENLSLLNESIFSRLKKALLELMRNCVANGIDKLPPEDVLSERMGVSRTVLRDVLSTLESQGYVIRRRSKGTIINKYVVLAKCRLDIDYEVEDYMRMTDKQYECSEMIVKDFQATAKSSAKLNVPVGHLLMHITKNYHSEGKLVATNVELFDKSFIVEPYEPDDLRGSVYDFLKQKCHISIEASMSNIHAQIHDGRPCLYVDDVGINLELKPLLWSRKHYYSDFFGEMTFIRNKR